MLKKLENIPSFIAGDLTTIQEILHPANDGIPLNYSLAMASLAEGTASLEHTLKESETYFIIKGEGEMYLSGKQFPVTAGDCIYIAPEERQYIRNTGSEPLQFLCIVSPPWSPDGETIL